MQNVSINAKKKSQQKLITNTQFCQKDSHLHIEKTRKSIWNTRKNMKQQKRRRNDPDTPQSIQETESPDMQRTRATDVDTVDIYQDRSSKYLSSMNPLPAASVKNGQTITITINVII